MFFGRCKAVVTYPDNYASYAVPVRQYRILQSRFLQCMGHPKPPCDLLILQGATPVYKGLAPSGKYIPHLSLALEILFVFLNFFNSVQQVCAACSCRAHTRHIVNWRVSSFQIFCTFMQSKL